LPYCSFFGYLHLSTPLLISMKFSNHRLMLYFGVLIRLWPMANGKQRLKIRGLFIITTKFSINRWGYSCPILIIWNFWKFWPDWEVGHRRRWLWVQGSNHFVTYRTNPHMSNLNCNNTCYTRKGIVLHGNNPSQIPNPGLFGHGSWIPADR
jgi:hypothetical protein